MGEEIAVMEAGRVVQRGTPDELYERPRNVYVASKIGSPHMNLFDGRVTADGRGGRDRARRDPGRRTRASRRDAAVTLGVRPADMRPAEAAPRARRSARRSA